MIPRLFTFAVLCACALSVTACAPQKQFYWGSYEDSLLSRQQDAGAGGDNDATAKLLATIEEAQASNMKVGPGIHADYGYLLFKQGKAEQAIEELHKEAMLFPESKPLMDTMVSRIQGWKDKEKETKVTP